MKEDNPDMLVPEAYEERLKFHAAVAEQLAAAAACANCDHPEHKDAYAHYWRTLSHALEGALWTSAMEGSLWTPARVRALYPTLAEVWYELDGLTRTDANRNAAFHAAKSVANHLTSCLENGQISEQTSDEICAQITAAANRVGVSVRTPYLLLSTLPGIVVAAEEQNLKLKLLPALLCLP